MRNWIRRLLRRWQKPRFKHAVIVRWSDQILNEHQVMALLPPDLVLQIMMTSGYDCRLMYTDGRHTDWKLISTFDMRFPRVGEAEVIPRVCFECFKEMAK